MSLRSFLSGLVSPGGAVPSSVPGGAPVALTRSITVGIGTVRRAALSPDGSRLAVATSLGAAVYAVDALDREAWFRPTQSWVVSVAFSGDGSRVIAGASDGHAWVWQADTGEPIATLKGQGPVHTALDRGGRVAALGQRTGVALWNVDDESELRVLEGTSQEVNAVAFERAGDKVAAVDHSGQVLLWQAESGRELARWLPGNQPLRAVAFSPDGMYLAAAGKEWTVWDIATAAQVATATAPGPFLCVGFSADGERLLTGTKRNRGFVWNVGSGEREGEILSHIDDVHSAAFAPNGDEVVLASQKIHWADRGTVEIKRSVPAFARASSIATSPDDGLIAVADKQVITVWQRGDGRAASALDGHTHTVRSMAFLPDGKSVVSSSPREIIAWDIASGRPSFAVRGHDASPDNTDVGHVAGLGVTSSGAALIAVVEDEQGRYTLAEHDAKTGERQGEIAGFPRRGMGIDGLALSPDDRWLALRGSSRLAVWDLANGEEAFSVDGAARGKGDLLWTPGSAMLIAAMGDGSAAMLDGASGRTERTLAGDGAAISGLVLSGDGTLLAGRLKGRPRDHVVVWDAHSGKVIHGDLGEALGDSAASKGAICHTLAFRPDNSTLVAGFSGPPSQGAEAGLWIAWHMATGEVIHKENGPAVWAAEFSRDGATLITASGDGQAIFWTVG